MRPTWTSSSCAMDATLTKPRPGSYARERALPLKVLSGTPGYINLLDALNAWQLVRELHAALALPAAASFKHVSPAGAAVAVPMSEEVRRASFVDDLDLSPLATAYARARGADRLCSFGDFAAMSDVVDVSTATHPQARGLRRRHRPRLRAGRARDPQEQAQRHLLRARDRSRLDERPRRRPARCSASPSSSDATRSCPGREHLANLVTKNRDLPDAAARDLILALITLKYTQSNSVCFAVDGQAIGIGAGQQSRIHCTRLAGGKADRWFLRQHPATLEPALPGRHRAARAEQRHRPLPRGRAVTPAEESDWLDVLLRPPPQRLTRRREARLARRASGREPGLATPSSPSATTSTAPRRAASSTSRSPAARCATTWSSRPPTSTAWSWPCPSCACSIIEMGTLGGFPCPPALWLRRAKLGYANAFAMGTL